LFGGAGEGKRNSRSRNAETFFTGQCEFRTTLCVCHILYVDQWKFRCSMSSGHHEGGPRSSIALGRHVLSSGFNNPSTWFRLLHVLKTVKGLPPRTPRRCGYDVYAHAVYVVICYMSLTCICLLCVVICYMSVICCMSVICLVVGGVVRVRLYVM
jgi:hypothetical protein